jgi:hypothetical protein
MDVELGIGPETVSVGAIVFFNGFHQAAVSFLDQICQFQTSVNEPPRLVDDHVQVSFDQLFLCPAPPDKLASKVKNLLTTFTSSAFFQCIQSPSAAID